MEDRSEIERIKKAYERRKEYVSSKLYSFFNRSQLFIVQRRDWEIIEALKSHGVITFEDKKILDVGCGGGRELLNLVRFGAKPEHLCGIDLLQKRIETARRLNPLMHFVSGDASNLPYEANSFDIVMQFTLFTSVLDTRMKREIAREMLRILKPDGIILWYDYHMNNPKNPDVRGVKKREIYELFNACRISLKRITLAPPLARALAPFSVVLCQILEKIPLLCTHYLGVIRKPQI